MVAEVVPVVGAATPSAPFVRASAAAIAPASVEVTVVEETCLEPDDLRPLEEPAETKIICSSVWGLLLRQA